jgi:hypothetical protein
VVGAGEGVKDFVVGHHGGDISEGCFVGLLFLCCKVRPVRIACDNMNRGSKNCENSGKADDDENYQKYDVVSLLVQMTQHFTYRYE